MTDRAVSGPRRADRAWIGLGANLGDRVGTLRAALRDIAALAGMRLVAQSSLWRSAPLDAPGDDYINAVALVETALDAPRLLAALQAVEARHGRERPYPNAPRTLDLDLLLHDEPVEPTTALTVPHPRLHERAFVLLPMHEVCERLAIDLDVPGYGALAGLLPAVRDQRIERLPES